VFTPVLAKHSKSFSLIDCISVGVDRMQRNFEPMRKQVEAWQRSELTDVTAKVVIYEEPTYDEFRSRTIWSLSNAFTTRSRNWNPSLNSKPQLSWASSWKRGSRNRSSRRAVSAERPFLTSELCSPTEFPEARFSLMSEAELGAVQVDRS
jgi:hypothetical protein